MKRFMELLETEGVTEGILVLMVLFVIWIWPKGKPCAVSYILRLIWPYLFVVLLLAIGYGIHVATIEAWKNCDHEMQLLIEYCLQERAR